MPVGETKAMRQRTTAKRVAQEAVAAAGEADEEGDEEAGQTQRKVAKRGKSNGSDENGKGTSQNRAPSLALTELSHEDFLEKLATSLTNPKFRFELGRSLMGVADPIKFAAFIARSRVAEKVERIEPVVPDLGGPILILDRRHFDLMLSGEKVYEVRSQILKPKICHVGHHGEIYGMLRLGVGFKCENEEQWEELRSQHRHSSLELPYKKTCLIRVHDPKPFHGSIPYLHRLGSIGTAKYAPPSEPKVPLVTCGNVVDPNDVD